MSTALQFFELRLSFIWTEVFSTLLAHGAPNAPMSFLADEAKFATKYDDILGALEAIENEWSQRYTELTARSADDPALPSMVEQLDKAYRVKVKDPDLLTLPWLSSRQSYVHHFWQYYFENTEPTDLTGGEAWSYVAPLRANIPVVIGSTLEVPKLRFMIDGLLYPHGTAVALTIRLLFGNDRGAGPGGASQGAGLTWMMDQAMKVRNDLAFPVTLPDGRKCDLKLDAVAEQCLTYLRARALGEAARRGAKPTQPLTVATVVQGQGANAYRPILVDSDVHKALEGLCSWDPYWYQQTNLASPADSNLLISDRTPGHLVYHLKRGRAVWMPASFCLRPPHAGHKLGCYHRNLSLVSLQTEMLAQLALLFTDFVEERKPISPALKSLAEHAVRRLGYLYSNESRGRKKYTYNSASPRLYLQEHGYVDIINQARAKFGLSPLHYSAH